MAQICVALTVAMKDHVSSTSELNITISKCSELIIVLVVVKSDDFSLVWFDGEQETSVVDIVLPIVIILLEWDINKSSEDFLVIPRSGNDECTTSTIHFVQPCTFVETML